jgi:hypothetical protein
MTLRFLGTNICFWRVHPLHRFNQRIKKFSSSTRFQRSPDSDFNKYQKEYNVPQESYSGHLTDIKLNVGPLLRENRGEDLVM